MTPLPPEQRRAAQQLRAVALWALGLFLTLCLAGLLAWAGVLLAIFGLAGVALAVAAAMTTIGLTVWRRGMLPMAVLSAALVLPAAAVALGSERFERSLGLLAVSVERPGDTEGKTYSRGSGPVFVDLRQLKATGGSTTRVKARTDNGPIVVALPHDQCLDLTVRVRDGGNRGDLTQLADASLRMVGIDNGQKYDTGWGPIGLTEEATARDERALSSATGRSSAFSKLQAYGRVPNGMRRSVDGYTWTRKTDEPGLAKVELDLSASDEITVRDYPDWAAPMSDGIADGYNQVSSVSWPNEVRSPVSPSDLQWRMRESVRTPENRARWVKWEREMVKFGIEQGRRAAGPCATKQELADRGWWFETQPATIKAPGKAPVTLLGGPTTRRSVIPQPAVPSKYNVLSVEVNGLGKVKTTGVTKLNPEANR
ncbi:MAG: hypothetical protein Q7T55_12265 [Solirubrobacteraceae bacterium]|nr:hypothetical protein [Solirubrobacteraceae bacterium]